MVRSITTISQTSSRVSAWRISLGETTVIRAAYGRFYDNWAAITQTAQNFEGTWPSLDQLGATNLNR